MARLTTHTSPTSSSENHEDWLKASRVVAGGVTFVLVLSASQLLQGRLLGISAASQLASTVGLVSVGVGSVAASFAADRAPSTLCATLRWAKPPRPSSLWSTPVEPEEQVLRALRTALVGALLFKGLGGRFNGIAPSDVARPGAFFRVRGSLKAGMEYANPLQKRRLDTFGLLYGCHTCGRRQIGDYIGDHMPPKKVAAEMSRRWWRRLLRIRVRQRFTPQCRPCSSIQSSAVRENKRVLIYHWRSLRRYHATGAAYEMVRIFAGDAVLDQAVHNGVVRLKGWWHGTSTLVGDLQRRWK